MKLSEAVRVAEKIKAWVPKTHQEWIVALDTLTDQGKPEPKPEPSLGDRILAEWDKVRTEVRTAFDGFAEDLIGPDLPDKPEPDREGLEKLRAREEVLRLLERIAFEKGFKAARLHYGHQDPDHPEGAREFHGAECVTTINTDYACTCDDAAADEEAHTAAAMEYPDPKPASAPPQAGDEVPNRDAAKLLPIGTVIRDKSGLVGVVSKTEGTAGTFVVVRWSEPHPSPVWPATIEWVA